MGVDRVIGQRPEDASHVEREDKVPVESPSGCCITQEDPPVDCEPKESLRPICKSLEEGVGTHKEERGCTYQLAVIIELQKDHEA